MKRVNVILLLTVFLAAGSVGYCGTVASPYQVGNWPGFRTAAVSYTFDDGCPYQYTIAIPMFNEFGYKLTMFTVTSPSFYLPVHWDQLQTAATAGHEIASHTVTHPTLTKANELAELANSKNTINANITPQQCVTIAYPFCVPGTEVNTAAYYIAGRHCQGYIEANTPSNFYLISSVICGSAGAVKTADDFNNKFVSAASTKGWCVFLIHGIDDDGGYSPLPSTVLRSSLQYLDARRSTYWVSTFSNVVRYIKERNDVSVSESSNTGDNITLQLTDTLNNAIYNYPVTIRRPLPAGWPSATVSQNGQAVNASLVVANATMYIMFDVVPDGGDVVLSKGIYGDFIGNGVVEMNDLSVFFKFWPVNDCNKIAGVDVDGDCIVNFKEFSVMAGNWPQPLE
jgi:hypothetical protein